MFLKESILMALDSVRSNKLRSTLTLMSIAIGIFAIIGSGTLVSSLTAGIEGELDKMGQTLYTVQQMPGFIMSGKEWRKYSRRPPLTYRQSLMLKDSMYTAQNASLFAYRTAAVASLFEKTDPDIQIIGSDEFFFEHNGYEIAEGRPLTPEDIALSRRVCVIGPDIVSKIFPVSPIGQEVNIKGHRFTVVGVTEARGALFGKKLDDFVVLPVSVFTQYFTDRYSQSLTVRIRATDVNTLEETVDRTIGVLRGLRRLTPSQENNFEVLTNDAIKDQFGDFKKYISMFGLASGLIALVAAGIGIMNIMLVTIKERTREIGVRKALGATPSAIMAQFITEAITLCQLGGVIGIGLGILAGLGLSSSLEMDISVPVDLVIFSVVICSILGVTFGGYPAWKAARLDPIDALRYE